MVCKDFIGCLFSFVNKNFVQFVLFPFFGGLIPALIRICFV